MKRITPFTFDRKFGDQPMHKDFSMKIPEEKVEEVVEDKPASTKRKPAKS